MPLKNTKKRSPHLYQPKKKIIYRQHVNFHPFGTLRKKVSVIVNCEKMLCNLRKLLHYCIKGSYVGLLRGWVFGCLAGWLISKLVGWLVGLLVGFCCLIGWLVSFFTSFACLNGLSSLWWVAWFARWRADVIRTCIATACLDSSKLLWWFACFSRSRGSLIRPWLALNRFEGIPSFNDVEHYKIKGHFSKVIF